MTLGFEISSQATDILYGWVGCFAGHSRTFSHSFFVPNGLRLSTTPGSARVEVSPSPSVSPAASLRKMRRMILPERALERRATISGSAPEVNARPMRYLTDTRLMPAIL